VFAIICWIADRGAGKPPTITKVDVTDDRAKIASQMTKEELEVEISKYEAEAVRASIEKENKNGS